MGSVLDPFDTLNRALRGESLSLEEGARSDAEALRGDLEAVGKDFGTILGEQEGLAPKRARKGRRGQLRRR